MLQKDVIDRTKDFSLEAGSIVRVTDSDAMLAQAILAAGMLTNEGLHALANSIEKRGHMEVAADTIAKAIRLIVRR